MQSPMPAHNRRYDFGEEALVNSVKVSCGVALDVLG